MATKTIKGMGKDVTTSRILNYIRMDADTAYKERIPAATAGNLTEIAQSFYDNPDIRNRLIPMLINKVAMTLYKTHTWTNPLASLKIGMMRHGETIEEVHTNLIKARSFRPEAGGAPDTNALGRYSPDTAVFYHPSLEPRLYPLSVDDNDILARGFRDEGAMSEYINGLVGVLAESAENDDYLIVKQYMSEFITANLGNLYQVQIGDLAAATGADRKEIVEDIAEKVRATGKKMTFRSTLYNPTGRDCVSKFEGLVILTTPEFEAALDVRALSVAFNMDKVALQNRIIVLDSLPIDGVELILMDDSTLIMADKWIEMRSQMVANGFYTNYFLLHDMLVSMSRVSNIALFTTKTPSGGAVKGTYTVTGVTVDDVDATGWKNIDSPVFNVQMTATVAGTATPVGLSIPQSVKWEISSIATKVGTAAAVQFVPDSGTQISPSGLFILSAKDAERAVTGTSIIVNIKATSTINNAFSDFTEITLAG